MTEKEMLLAMSNLLDEKLQPIKDELGTVKDKLETVERDVKHLKKQSIRQQAMDEAILDEVERVHDILDMHKADKSVHMA